MEAPGIGPKVLILCGGAPGGCTDEMCRAASEALSEAGYSPETIMPSEMGISHCTGCQRCAGGRGCVIGDRMSEIYRSFADCEGVVLATPLRFSGPSSIIKVVMDRMQVYWGSPDLPRPQWVILMACAGSEAPDFSHLRSMMRAFSVTLGMEWRGEAYVAGTDSGMNHVRQSAKEAVERILRDRTGR